jgi:ubiquinone/menaquinone biosynthesis C-methylase UbiE
MHKFEPAHTARLLSAEREKALSPKRLLEEAGLKAGDTFIDVGCGPGFFTMPAAAIAGEKGKVFAVDTQQDMLDQLKARKPPKNVILLKSRESSVPVDASSADLVLIAFVLHEAERKTIFLREIKRITKAGGTVLIIDWKKKREEHGPPVEERLTAKAVEELLRGAGFRGVKASSLNASHYRISARKG